MSYKDRPNRYKEHNLIEILEGDHRVQISKVSTKAYKYGKRCFEITLKVSGHHGKLWYYLWYDPSEKDRTNQRFYDFFTSFEIYDYDLEHYKSWVGHYGAVNVKYHYVDMPSSITLENVDSFDPPYWYEAKVHCCIHGPRRNCLPDWRDGPTDAFNDLIKKELYF